MIDRRIKKGTILNRQDYNFDGVNPLRKTPYEYKNSGVDAVSLRASDESDHCITVNPPSAQNTYIRNLRKYLKLTQKAFGELCGVGSMTVYFWEKGERTPSNAAMMLMENLVVDKKP